MPMFYNLGSTKYPDYRRCTIIHNDKGWITARMTKSGITFTDWACYFTGALLDETGVV